MLTLSDLRNCLAAVSEAAGRAKQFELDVLQLCDNNVGATPYRRAAQATSDLAATRRTLFCEIEALERQVAEGRNVVR
jgi:hypothetical protein